MATTVRAVSTVPKRIKSHSDHCAISGGADEDSDHSVGGHADVKSKKHGEIKDGEDWVMVSFAAGDVSRYTADGGRC